MKLIIIAAALTFFISKKTVYGNICFDSTALDYVNKNSKLALADFPNVCAHCLGYTVNGQLWDGVKLKSPFKALNVALVVGVKNDDIPIHSEGTCFKMNENDALEHIYKSLKSHITAVARKKVTFQLLESADLTDVGDVQKLGLKSLKISDPLHSAFLKDMNQLKTIAKKASANRADDKQNIIFVNIKSFSPIATKHGKNSSEVTEALRVMKNTLTGSVKTLKESDPDRVMAVVIETPEAEEHGQRFKRQAFSDAQIVKPVYGSTFSGSFPIMFNIFLFLGIILTVAIIAASVAIAFMDPGRDSIIYRMTNPKMKKDQ